MEKTLKLEICVSEHDWENKHSLVVDFFSTDPCDSSRISTWYSPDEHQDFNKRIGDEIYAYIADWMEERSDRNE